jgi:hypothetical protein
MKATPSPVVPNGQLKVEGDINSQYDVTDNVFLCNHDSQNKKGSPALLDPIPCEVSNRQILWHLHGP